jgi:hypothetical protein
MTSSGAITVRELASQLGVSPVVIIRRLLSMGAITTVDQPLPGQIVEELRRDLGSSY